MTEKYECDECGFTDEPENFDRQQVDYNEYEVICPMCGNLVRPR